MNSPFLYLNKRKLTLKTDSEKYEQLSSNSQKRVAWKMFSSFCFCKLYDLSSLPKPKNQRLALYVGVCMLVCAATLYRESSG